jgi:hypothetical protein
VKQVPLQKEKSGATIAEEGLHGARVAPGPPSIHGGRRLGLPTSERPIQFRCMPFMLSSQSSPARSSRSRSAYAVIFSIHCFIGMRTTEWPPRSDLPSAALERDPISAFLLCATNRTKRLPIVRWNGIHQCLPVVRDE